MHISMPTGSAKMPRDAATPWIREFRLEDMAGILRIEEQASPKTAYSRSAFLHYKRVCPEGFYVIGCGEEVVGYIIYDGGGHLHSMALRPEWRRKGLGTMLFRHAQKQIKKGLWLEVRWKNTGAQTFYKRMGMEIMGRVPGYYGDDDALLMQLIPGQ